MQTKRFISFLKIWVQFRVGAIPRQPLLSIELINIVFVKPFLKTLQFLLFLNREKNRFSYHEIILVLVKITITFNQISL